VRRVSGAAHQDGRRSDKKTHQRALAQDSSDCQGSLQPPGAQHHDDEFSRGAIDVLVAATASAAAAIATIASTASAFATTAGAARVGGLQHL
jgi:hypothetical protein